MIENSHFIMSFKNLETAGTVALCISTPRFCDDKDFTTEAFRFQNIELFFVHSKVFSVFYSFFEVPIHNIHYGHL